MSPPHRLCIFSGCHNVQGNGAVSLFKFPKEENVRKRLIDFVKRSYCGKFKIPTNTRLCSVHFTPDSYNNYHQAKSGYLKSLLALASGAKPTLPVPGLHPPVLPTATTAGATITATGIMCLPPTLSVPPTTGATITAYVPATGLYPHVPLTAGETADHRSQSIISSLDIKMSNWTAAEIQ